MLACLTWQLALALWGAFLAGMAAQSRIVSNPTIQALLANQALATPLNALDTRPAMLKALMAPYVAQDARQ